MHHDCLRVQLGDQFVAGDGARKGARCPCFHHHICPRDHPAGDIDASSRLEIDVNAQLRRVERAEEVGHVDVDDVVFERRVGAQAVESRAGFDPHHGRAVIGERLRRDGPHADPAEVRDAQAGERQIGITHAPRCRLSGRLGRRHGIGADLSELRPDLGAVLVEAWQLPLRADTDTVDGRRAAGKLDSRRIALLDRPPEVAHAQVLELDKVGHGVDWRNRLLQHHRTLQECAVRVPFAQPHHRLVELVERPADRFAGRGTQVVGVPLLGSPALVCEALFDVPVEQPARRHAPGDTDRPAVLGAVAHLERHGQLRDRARALEVAPADRVGLHGIEQRPGHRRLGRHADVLCRTGDAHAGLGHEPRRGGFCTRMTPRLCDRGLHGRPLEDPLHVRRSAECRQRQL